MDKPPQDAAGCDAACVRAALGEVLHPDAGASILDLGLVRGIEVRGGDVRVRMAMILPDNPSRGLLIEDIENLIRARCRAVRSVSVELVRDPPLQPQPAEPWGC